MILAFNIFLSKSRIATYRLEAWPKQYFCNPLLLFSNAVTAYGQGYNLYFILSFFNQSLLISSLEQLNFLISYYFFYQIPAAGQDNGH